MGMPLTSMGGRSYGILPTKTLDPHIIALVLDASSLRAVFPFYQRLPKIKKKKICKGNFKRIEKNIFRFVKSVA